MRVEVVDSQLHGGRMARYEDWNEQSVDGIVRWAEIQEAPGYEVSNDGRVRQVKKVRHKNVSPHPDCRYGVMRFWLNGRIVVRSLKRLVQRYHA